MNWHNVGALWAFVLGFIACLSLLAASLLAIEEDDYKRPLLVGCLTGVVALVLATLLVGGAI